MWVDGPDDGAECLSVVSGSGLLSQYGDHAPGREAPQRDDRPPAEEGTPKNLMMNLLHLWVKFEITCFY